MDIFIIIISYLVFLLSTTFHEASHALAAKLGGDLTASNSGQVSLDPMPHIQREPLGMVVFPIIFLFINGWPFGWASAPYDPVWARNNHRRAALMALAGPMSNLLLAVICGLALKTGLTQGVFTYSDIVSVISFHPEAVQSGFVQMFGIAFYINMILFTLNLLPLPALDGSSVITLFMPKNAANAFSEVMNNPMLALLSMFLIFTFFQYVFGPVYDFALGLLF